MSFILHRPDGTERELKGYRYAAPRGARVYSAEPRSLPPRVDMRTHMTAIEDQQNTKNFV